MILLTHSMEFPEFGANVIQCCGAAVKRKRSRLRLRLRECE
jgi:hypothetical protein